MHHDIFSKQDVFVGFATVPGFVSLTSDQGSPYLQVRVINKLISDYKCNEYHRHWPPSCLTTMTPSTWRTSTSWSRGSWPG